MSTTVVTLGPWGGSGGTAFNDGWNNGGVKRVTIYYDTILNGLEVLYENDTVQLHGQATGQTKQISNTGPLTAIDISVTVDTNSVFSGDPNEMGVVAVGLTILDAPTPVPSGVSGTVYLPRVLGFFGSSGDYIDSLGLYVSNV